MWPWILALFFVSRMGLALTQVLLCIYWIGDLRSDSSTEVSALGHSAVLVWFKTVGSYKIH